MDANKKRDSIPETFDSIEAAAEFWDTHSLADYEDHLREINIEVRARQRRRVTLVPEIWELVVSQAHIHGVSPETLVNVWLMEHAQV